MDVLPDRVALDVRARPEATPTSNESKPLREIKGTKPTQRTLVLDIVKSKPGIAIGELLELVPIGGGTLYHHLTKLEQSGLIYFCTYGRRRLVYPANRRVSVDQVAATSILRGRSARRIGQAVVKRKRCTVLDLSEDVGESPRVVYYHIQRMAEAGLIDRIYLDGRADIAPRPVLVAAVEALRPEADADAHGDNALGVVIDKVE